MSETSKSITRGYMGFLSMYMYIHGSLVTLKIYTSHHNENTMVSVHKSNKTCSVHFAKIITRNKTYVK